MGDLLLDVYSHLARSGSFTLGAFGYTRHGIFRATTLANRIRDEQGSRPEASFAVAESALVFDCSGRSGNLPHGRAPGALICSLSSRYHHVAISI